MTCVQGQERDTNEPTNVLEMMKMWKDELKNDSAAADSDSPSQVSVSPSPSSTRKPSVPSSQAVVDTKKSPSRDKVSGPQEWSWSRGSGPEQDAADVHS